MASRLRGMIRAGSCGQYGSSSGGRQGWAAHSVPAARLHARDLGPRGALTHVGADGRRLSERLERLGTWHGLIAENIGTLEEDPRQVVIQLLVDDGVPSRGHRHNLFNPDLHQAGVGLAPHRDYQVVTVIDYADSFVLGH